MLKKQLLSAKGESHVVSYSCQEIANAHITMEAFIAEAAANHSDVWYTVVVA